MVYSEDPSALGFSPCFYSGVNTASIPRKEVQLTLIGIVTPQQMCTNSTDELYIGVRNTRLFEFYRKPLYYALQIRKSRHGWYNTELCRFFISYRIV